MIFFYSSSIISKPIRTRGVDELVLLNEMEVALLDYQINNVW